MIKVTFNNRTANEAWESVLQTCHNRHESKYNDFEKDDDGDVTINDSIRGDYEDGYRYETTFYKCAWIHPHFEGNTLILGLLGARDDRYKLTNAGWIFYHQKMIELIMRHFRYNEFTIEIDCNINKVYDKITHYMNIE